MNMRLTCFSHRWLNQVAHALVRAVSRLVSTPWWHTDTLSSPGVGMSADAARMSACATSSPPNVCEKCRLMPHTFLAAVRERMRHPRPEIKRSLTVAAPIGVQPASLLCRTSIIGECRDSARNNSLVTKPELHEGIGG